MSASSTLAGRVWWSFYESDATLENFITRALAYVSRRGLEEIKKLALPDREQELLAILDRRARSWAVTSCARPPTRGPANSCASWRGCGRRGS